MTTLDERIAAINAGPILRYADVNVGRSLAGEHMAIYDRLREQQDITFGDADGNPYWLISRMDDIRDVFQNDAVFSSSAVTPADPNPPYKWIPEMLDGREHANWRQLLGPLFSPGTVDALEPKMRSLFNEILDETEGNGGCDFVTEVGLRYPNTIFMDMLGLPRSDAAQFQAWETRILHGDVAQMKGDGVVAMNEVVGYFGVLMAERRKQPKDDLLSKSMEFRIDGEPVNDADLMALLLLLFMAGLDTVAMQLSYSMLHLAQNDSDRERLVAEPQLIPSAIEEFVRYYAFVAPGRKIMSDIEVGGCPMKAGQMVNLPLVSANRDPRAFPDADKVIIDRTPNPHIGFGAGRHRCLGSHLARRELKVGLEEWHKRIPSYRLDPAVEVIEHGGQFGLDNVPLLWN